jgi:hypothetical protein
MPPHVLGDVPTQLARPQPNSSNRHVPRRQDEPGSSPSDLLRGGWNVPSTAALCPFSLTLGLDALMRESLGPHAGIPFDVSSFHSSRLSDGPTPCHIFLHTSLPDRSHHHSAALHRVGMQCIASNQPRLDSNQPWPSWGQAMCPALPTRRHSGALTISDQRHARDRSNDRRHPAHVRLA